MARIWSHPWALHLERLKQIERRKYKDDDSLDEFIDDESENTTSEEEDDKKPKWSADTSSDEEGFVIKDLLNYGNKYFL